MTDRDRNERDCLLLRIYEPYCRLSFALGQCRPGKLNDGLGLYFDLSDDCRAKTHRVRWIAKSDLHDVGASCRIRLRRDLADMAAGNDRRIIRQGDGYLRIFRTLSNKLGGDIKDGVSVSLLGDLQNHSPGCDDFARFCSLRRHRSPDV